MDITDQPDTPSSTGDGISSGIGRFPDSERPVVPVPARRTAKIATVSHTLDAAVAERLRQFAFRQRISESAVIEVALRELFEGADDTALGTRLRDAGAALRRKS